MDNESWSLKRTLRAKVLRFARFTGCRLFLRLAALLSVIIPFFLLPGATYADDHHIPPPWCTDVRNCAWQGWNYNQVPNYENGEPVTDLYASGKAPNGKDTFMVFRNGEFRSSFPTSRSVNDYAVDTIYQKAQRYRWSDVQTMEALRNRTPAEVSEYFGRFGVQTARTASTAATIATWGKVVAGAAGSNVLSAPGGVICAYAWWSDECQEMSQQ